MFREIPIHIRQSMHRIAGYGRWRLIHLVMACCCMTGVFFLMLRAASSSSGLVPFIDYLGGRNAVILMICLAIAATATVIIRADHPLPVLIIEFVEILLSLTLGRDGSSLVQGDVPLMQTLLFVAVYCCVHLPPFTQTACDLAALSSVYLQFTFLDVTRLAFPVLFPAMAACGVASSMLTLARQRRDADRRVEQAERRADEFELQRDHAERRARLSNELHDGVGHDLTAIIALSQGGEALLHAGKDDPADIEQAFATITTIARECLDETRRALRDFERQERSVDDADATDMIPQSPHPMHDWNDIHPILDRVRRTGIPVVLTETGKREDNPARADLCFAITREAITNALRHDGTLTGIAVSWDHRTDGSTSVTIRDESASPDRHTGHDDQANAENGSGLRYLADRVGRAGGTLEYGPTDDGWTVTATIP